MGRARGLAIAVMVAFSFCNPASGVDRTPRSISTGEPVIETPEPTPTQTPVPVAELPQPEQWFFRFITSAEPDSGVEDTVGFVEALDFDYDGAPYPGLTDDNWTLTASADWDLPAGRYGFTITRDGAIAVAVSGEEIRYEPDAEGAQQMRVVFDHPGGPLEVLLTMPDRGGPTLLR